MRTRYVVVTVGICLLILAVACFYLGIGGLMFDQQDQDRKRVGYCFDVATDRGTSRLLVAAGDQGLHLFDLDQGKLRYVMTYYDDGYYRNVKVWNDRAFVADARRGLVVLDITSGLPTTTWFQSRSAAYSLHLEQDLAFVAANEHWNRLP